MASLRRDLLVALCVVALFAVESESHGLEDFGEGKNEATPEMASFFGAKPEAAQIPEALDAPTLAKPEAASALPATTSSSSSAPPRRSVSVAAGVACGIAAVAVVGVAVAVAFVVRARRGAGRDSAVQLGSL